MPPVDEPKNTPTRGPSARNGAEARNGRQAEAAEGKGDGQKDEAGHAPVPAPKPEVPAEPAEAEAGKEVKGAPKKLKIKRHIKGVTVPRTSDGRFDPTRAVEVNPTHHALFKHARKAAENLEYDLILQELQIELVMLQEWVKATGAKLVVLFEGRDAAGKGGAISRMTEVMSPRVTKVVALSAPTEEEKTQWYFQRYVRHLPSAGQIVLFDRSWYNRAGVERVMGFATEEEVDRFMKEVPVFEQMLVDSGITLVKLWFDVSDAEQERRFERRLTRSWKRWKLSPMDLFARSKWFEYAHARDEMFKLTGETVHWTVVPSDNKQVARLNAISHILSQLPYEEQPIEAIELPPRQEAPQGQRVAGPFRPKCKNAVLVNEVYSDDGLSTDDEGKRWRDLAEDTLLVATIDEQAGALQARMESKKADKKGKDKREKK